GSRRTGPKGYTRSDDRLKDEVVERLMSRLHIDLSEVSIDVKDGKVTLEGSVQARHLKHEIEDVVDDVFGVKDIDNRIRVGGQGGWMESNQGGSSTGGSSMSASSSGGGAGSTGGASQGGAA